MRLIVSHTSIEYVCLVYWVKPFKIPFSISCSLYRDNERNKKTDLSCCKIQPGEIPWFRCPLQTAPVRTDGFFLPCPVLKKVYIKRVNLMQKTTKSDLSRHYLPRQLRNLILQEYLSGVKTSRQLSEEHGIPMSTIHKMGQRWKAKNSCSFVSTPNPLPIMSRVTSAEASELLSENKALRRRLEEALLRLEGYEIMGDILQEEYGIDLLKKSAAGQSSVSKKDTQQ